MKKYTHFALLIVVLLAFFLRFYKVTEIPPSLNWDEVSIAYNSYSILKTGRDEWNKPFPVHFKSYGEYKLPAQVYLSIPAIQIFGLNEFGVRITPVIYGTLTVLVIFFLGKILFQSSIAGLTSAFLLAISPWHIQLTRGSFESAMATFWVSLGVWFLVKGFKGQKWFVISMIPFGLSVFTYNSARIFTPLFLLTILLIYRRKLIQFKKALLLSIIFFIILLTPIIPFVLGGEGSSRYKLVSITDDPGFVQRINQNRGDSKFSQPLPQLIHNKVTYAGFYFANNYLAHFTPQFLFISGAPHKQHHVQDMGQLYFFQAPLLIAGVVGLFYLKHRFKGLLLSWIFISFIPVAVTNDSIPHALRTLIAVPFYQLVSGYGFLVLLKQIKRLPKIIIGGLVLGLLILISVNFGSYINNYYNIYPNIYSRDWQYGYKQVVEFIGKNKDQYDQIVFSRHFGEPHMFTLFYSNYDPAKFQTSPNLVRFETHDWVRVLRFDKFFFPDLGDEGTRFADIVRENPGKKLMFVGRAKDFPEEMPRIFSVDFLDGQRAFDIVEVKP